MPTAPDFGSQEEQISAHLAHWEAASAAGDKLVWLLEHDYSEAGLSFDGLKSTDAAVGGVLARAARRAQHTLVAAILHIEESGYADESGGFPDWDHDDDDWEMEEVFSSTRTLDGWGTAGSLPTGRGPTTASFRCCRENCCRRGRWKERSRMISKRP